MATKNRAPTSDQSVSGSWTGTAGSRYTVVDDYPDSTPTDYLEHGTTAGYLTFGFTAFDVPSGSTGISVQVRFYDAEPASGNNRSACRITVGGTNYDSAYHNPAGTTYTARSYEWANNPKSGSAWTVDDVNGVGTNALQYFGFFSGDANPKYRVSCIEIQVTYTAPVTDRFGKVSWAEMEAPNAARGARVSWAEAEVPTAPRKGQVSWAELETPNGARGGRVSWAELETPDVPPRQAEVSWAELEVPSLGNAAQISWAEFEAPLAPRKGLVSWAELETPLAPRRLLESWAELEVPLAPRRLLGSWAEMEFPADPRRIGQVSWAELQVPDKSRMLLSWAEFDAGGGASGPGSHILERVMHWFRRR